MGGGITASGDIVRSGRPEGAKHHSPGRSPGSRRPSPENLSPEGAKHQSPGRSPGSERHFKNTSPEGAKHIDGFPPVSFRGDTPSHRDGTSGAGVRPSGGQNWQKWARSGSRPRATPWAGILCPFGAYGKNGTGLGPRLRPGLISCAPSGRWPLGRGAMHFGQWDYRLGRHRSERSPRRGKTS
mgnify:CR=1 FL=1